MTFLPVFTNPFNTCQPLNVDALILQLGAWEVAAYVFVNGKLFGQDKPPVNNVDELLTELSRFTNSNSPILQIPANFFLNQYYTIIDKLSQEYVKCFGDLGNNKLPPSPPLSKGNDTPPRLVQDPPKIITTPIPPADTIPPVSHPPKNPYIGSPIVIPPRSFPVNVPVTNPNPNVTYHKYPNPVYDVKNPSHKRKYGRMLHQPVSNQPVYVGKCKPNPNVSSNSSYGDTIFNESWFKDKQQDAFKSLVKFLMPSVSSPNVKAQISDLCKIGFSVLSAPVLAVTGPAGVIVTESAAFYGCDIVADLALNYLRRNIKHQLGIRSTVPSGIIEEDCPPLFRSPSPSLPFDLRKPEIPCPCPTDTDETFVPIRNFKMAAAGGGGYKLQLQIIFNDPTTHKPAREITVPYPYLDVTADDIVAAIVGAVGSTTVPFGEVKSEVDCSPYGYLRYYAPDETIGALMLTALSKLINGAIIQNTMRFSDRQRNFSSGGFTANKANLLMFSASVKDTKRIKLLGAIPTAATHTTVNII